MNLVRSVLREPVVQFLLIGAVTFGAYLALNRDPPAPPREVVEVGPGRIEQIARIFAKTWQRPPTRDELDGMVDAFVKEEIFYREGKKLGLDQDDTVFRRRLQQKMEFLIEPDEADMTPGDGELEAFLAANADKYVYPYRASFEQIFFNPSRREGKAQADAVAVLASLRDGETPGNGDALGDATLLPRTMPLSGRHQIEGTFGRAFADSLETLEPGRWSGPVESEFGYHLVRLDAFEPAHRAELGEIRDIVLRDWQDEKRRTTGEERYRRLKENYRVVIDWPEGMAPDPAGGGSNQ